MWLGRRGSTAITAVGAALVIFAPALVYVAHGPGQPIENRAPEAYTGLDEGWDSFGALGRFIASRLPLRTTSVRADAWVDEHVFREDPAFGGAATPRVLRGDQGFLFIADAIDVACAPHATPQESAASLAELAEIIKASGREVLTMVAPDKSTVHPELLPVGMAKRECFDEYTNELWSDMASAGIEGYVDLRAALKNESADSREPLYFRKDTHWDSAGSLVAVKAMVDALAPGLWSDAEVHYLGLTRYGGDLTVMQGGTGDDEAPIYQVQRPDVVSVSVEQIDDIAHGFNRRFINDAPPGRLIEGRTVLFLDSFGLAALTQITPFFRDLTIIHVDDYEPQKFLDAIDSADRVWFLTVERSLSYRLQFGIGSRDFLDLLDQELSQKV
ncbi:MAG: hypothetical protein K8R99_12065 [Actinomycetia bacterium]|nr:hypothetical protein [Actinomycetes bacterium]